jgi:BNR/Asp-box repeat
MKKFLFFASSLMLFLSSCSNKEHTLLDFQPVYYNTDSLLSVSIANAGPWFMVQPEKLVSFQYGTWYEFDLATRTLETSPCLPELDYWFIEYQSKDLDTLIYLDRYSGECSIITNKGTTKAKTVQLPPSVVHFDFYGDVNVHQIRGVHFFNAEDAIIMADYHPKGTGIYTDMGIHIYEIKDFEDVDTLAYVRQQFDGDYTNCEGLDLSMVDRNVGYMIVRDRTNTGELGNGLGQIERRTMKTIDGGKTWQFLGPEFYPGQYGGGIYMEWLMVLKNENLLSGSYNGQYIVSSDGGVNWKILGGDSWSMFQQPKEMSDGTLVGAAYVSDYDAFRHYPTELNISKDNGVNWSKGGTRFYGEYFHCFDDNNWVAGKGSLIQITRDGGKTWDLVSAPLNN